MEFTTLRQRVDALPEPERSARRMLYTDVQWVHSWELNAYPHQVQPKGEWDVWSIIGSRGTGKSEAGYRWMEHKFLSGGSPYDQKFLMLMHHKHDTDRYRKRLYDKINDLGALNEFRMKVFGDRTTFQLEGTGRVLTIMTVSENRSGMGYGMGYRLPRLDYDYVWADEITDAQDLVVQLRDTEKFIFTGPVKLPFRGFISRAGDSGPEYYDGD